jgi:hypothetical protein
MFAVLATGESLFLRDRVRENRAINDMRPAFEEKKKKDHGFLIVEYLIGVDLINRSQP